MEEGSRPLRLRGTPAGKHRHYVALIAVGVSVFFGILMETRRFPQGIIDKIITKKPEEQDIQDYMRRKDIFGQQFYAREKAIVKLSKEAESEESTSFITK